MRGPDVMALGEMKGPAIGEILRTLEAEWVRAASPRSREELLARASELSRKLPKPDR